jgi:hypothetical protein
MSVEQPSVFQAGLVDRVKNILLQPTAEWQKIEAEPKDTGKLITGYLLPLAGAAVLAFAIGATVFGYGAFGFTVHLPLTTVIGMAVTQLVMAVVSALVFAWIVNALAPSFGSTQDIGQAQKLVVYSATASYVAALFQIFPPLAMLGILGIYSLVLLYKGMPVMMKTPLDKRIGYLVTCIIAAIVLGIVASVVLGSVKGMLGMGMAGLGGGPLAGINEPAKIEGKVTLPGGGTVDLSEMEKYAKQMESAAKDGAMTKVVDATKLQAMMPAALPGGFTQDAISSQSGGAAGMSAASADATFKRGDATITVNIVHSGAMGAMAGMAGALGVNANKQDSNGYMKTNTVDGRVITEEVDRSANSAKYAIVGKNGVMLSADGAGGATIDDVKAAVNAIGIGKLEALGAAP